MEKKSFWIGVLSLTAVILFVANYFAPTPVRAFGLWKDRDYTVTTARVQQGGEVLYVLDNRSGRVAVFAYDTNTRTIVPRAPANLPDVFSGR